MHKLDRGSVPKPSCLASSQPGRRYSDLRGAEKEEIRAALLTLQKNRCAYCERRTGADRDDGHIEHFRNQAGHSEMQVDWANMFWSCPDEKSCGKHKDKCDRPFSSGPQSRFNPDELIDPSMDDPDDFLLFLTNGTVRPRAGLNDAARRRAEETIRVFHLADSAYLRKSREDAVKPLIRAIDIMHTKAPELVQTYIQNELTQLDSAPYAAAIRHFFKRFLP